MKKLISLLMMVILAVSSVTYASAAADEITVYLENNKIESDTQPQTINSRTMVPIRAIFEAMGAAVEWDAETQTAICTKGGTIVKMTVNSETEYINDTAYTMDAAPVIIYGRTLAPARYVAEAFGYFVSWDEKTKSVLISQPLTAADTVLYEDSNLKVTYGGLEKKKYFDDKYTLKLNVENKYEQNINIRLADCYINDIKVDTYGNLGLDGLEAYKKAIGDYTLECETTGISGVSDINKLEFKLNLYGRDYKTIMTTDAIVIQK